MTDKEVMQMALDALLLTVEEMRSLNGSAVQQENAIEALRACLAQPEQYDQTELELCKKCGWKAVWPDGCLVCEKQETQPEKEWVGLTHEEKMEILTRNITAPSRIDVAEALLKEKNNG